MVQQALSVERAESVWLRSLKTQGRVIYAVMMHDIKSRFFGNGIGYIVTVLWPASHLAIIVGIFYFAKRKAPYGESDLLYASIGVLPYIIWNYISRFTHLGVLMNKPYLQYALINPLDLIIGRQCLELVTCTIVIFGVWLFLLMAGVDPMPHRTADAAYAIGSAVLLGIGFGITGAVISMVFPLFNVLYVGVLILAWVSSGLIINPEQMPVQIGNMLAWNPLLHSIEWLREAYYDDFPTHLLDRTYVLEWGLGSIAVGLIMERMLRPITKN